MENSPLLKLNGFSSLAAWIKTTNPFNLKHFLSVQLYFSSSGLGAKDFTVSSAYFKLNGYVVFIQAARLEKPFNFSKEEFSIINIKIYI